MLRFIFAHTSEGYQATKRVLNGLVETRLVLFFAPLSAFRTQSDSSLYFGREAGLMVEATWNIVCLKR